MFRRRRRDRPGSPDGPDEPVPGTAAWARGTLPVERLTEARALLGTDSAAGHDADEAKATVLRLLDTLPSFPLPDDRVAALRDAPDVVDVHRRVADAALRGVLLAPGGRDAGPMADAQMIASRTLWRAIGDDERPRFGFALAVTAFVHAGAGRPTDGLTMATEGVRHLTSAVAHDPARSQLALALCLEASARCRLALGSADGAAGDLERASTVLDAVAAREGRPRPEQDDLARALDAVRNPAGTGAGHAGRAGRSGAAPAGGPGGRRRAAGGAAAADEPATRLAEADTLFDAGVRRSRNGALADAERSLAQAADIYEEVGGPDGAAGRARAQWRLSMTQFAAGRRPEAIDTGRAAVAAWRDARRRSDASPEWAAEEATTLTDISVLMGETGLVAEAADLAEAAVTARREQQPRDAAALATALHNMALATANRVRAAVGPDGTLPPGGPTVHDLVAGMRAALAAVEEAVALRERLDATGVPIHRWELANSLLLRGTTRTFLDDLNGAVADLNRAMDLAAGLGPGADGLRTQAEQNRQLLRFRGVL